MGDKDKVGDRDRDRDRDMNNDLKDSLHLVLDNLLRSSNWLLCLCEHLACRFPCRMSLLEMYVLGSRWIH